MLHGARKNGVAVHESLPQAVVKKELKSCQPDPSCWAHVAVIVVGTDFKPPTLLRCWGCPWSIRVRR